MYVWEYVVWHSRFQTSIGLILLGWAHFIGIISYDSEARVFITISSFFFSESMIWFSVFCDSIYN